MWQHFIHFYGNHDWPAFDYFYGVTPGYHKQNQKKLRRMRRQGCKV